jgi:hypothetical protein
MIQITTYDFPDNNYSKFLDSQYATDGGRAYRILPKN